MAQSLPSFAAKCCAECQKNKDKERNKKFFSIYCKLFSFCHDKD